MSIEGKFVEPSSALWAETLGLTDHDFYHFPDYSVLAAQPGQTPRAFVAQQGEHRMLVPFLQQPIPAELGGAAAVSDAISPYGYPGPVWSRGAPQSFMTDSLALLSESMKAEGIISAFFRLHTLLNNADQFAGIGELVSHGPTVYMDLTATEEELWKQTRRGHRREILGLQQAGYVAEIDENWEALDDFMLCYNQTMDRVNASPFYYFPKEYFLKLREMLGDNINMCVVRLNGDIACAGIATEVDGICQYHLSATAHAHLQAHPSKLMLNFLRSWLKQRGNRVFNFGGGVGSLEDTLYLFKMGFSPYAADFNTWRLINDPERYAEILARWSAQSGKAPVDPKAFFPQYRASLT